MVLLVHPDVVLHAELLRQEIQLIQFQPEPVGGIDIKLQRSEQRSGQVGHRAMDRQADDFQNFPVFRFRQRSQDDGLIAGTEISLEPLCQAGYGVAVGSRAGCLLIKARAKIVQGRSQALQKIHAHWKVDEQPGNFESCLSNLGCSIWRVRHGQAAYPIGERIGIWITK